MGDWSFVNPEATTNYITNPSFEVDTTGWTNSNLNTFERSTTRGFKGIASLHCVSDNTGDYCYGNAVSDADAAESWTATVRVWVVSGDFKLTIQENNGGYTDKANATTSTTGQWVEVTVTATLTAGVTDGRVKLGPNATAASEFYVDCIQFENKAYRTTFCDGEQPGCSWNGAKHNSTSTRSAQSRAGGRVIDLDATYGTKTTQMDGFGLLAPIQGFSEQALTPGGILQSSKDPMRVLVLTITAKGTSLANLHSMRKDLIEAFKPDLVKREGRKPQPVRLRYTGAGTEVEIAGHYAGGLEGVITAGTFERMAVRFVCEDPYFREIGESAASLTAYNTAANLSYAAMRRAGQWVDLNAGPGGSVYAIAVASDGSVYVGGDYTNLGGNANADYIAKYDPVTNAWSALGTGLTGGYVKAIAIAADGSVYVGGTFTGAGGVANTAYIAKWTGSAWEALGTGSSGTVTSVDALAIGQDGTLYIGGAFINWGGANGDGIVKWSGSAFSALGTGTTDTVQALAVGKDGSIYAGGLFASAGGTTVNAVAKWNGSAWSALGSGVSGADGDVYSLAIAADGTLYIGGYFTTAGGVTCNSIAKWNGSAWSSLSSGMSTGTNHIVFGLAIDNSGLLYAVGSFTTAGGLVLADRIAIWNGATWAHIDVDLPGTPWVYAVALAPQASSTIGGQTVYLGYDTSGDGTRGALQVVTNGGTEPAYPKLVIKRSGGTTARLEWLKNESNEQICWFNYSLLDGETLTIDFAAKTIVSDFFGNVIGRALLPSSNFGAFCLLPGSNSLTLYVYSSGSPTITASMVWTNEHHSVDGVAA